MLFTNVRSYNNQVAPPQKQIMMFTTNRRHIPMKSIHVPSKVSVVVAQTYEEQVAKIQDGKKVKWGEPFWNLFHVLAEHIKESEFSRLRAGLLNLIYLICSNLPCPDCTNHAVHYLNGINFNTIRNKEDLKIMMFNFHNAVNARKGYPIYPIDKMDKYKMANVVVVINTFMSHFLAKNKSFHLIADDMQRRQISVSVKEWFQTNIGAFTH